MKKGIQIISLSMLDDIDLSKYDYIYWGTETCIFKNKFDYEIIDENYLQKYKKLLNGKKLVYVTGLLPFFVEDKFYTFLDLLISIFDSDLEITINDLGILNYIKKKGYTIDLNIGVNLYYQVRDPYAKVIESERFLRISIDNSYYNNFFKAKGFKGLELFYPNHGIELQNLSFPIYLYYPYIQYSFTRACPWSLDKAGEKVSKLILDCSGCDKNYYKQQVKQNLKWKDLLVESIYIPNGQYYKLKKNIDEISKEINISRIIDNSLLIEN